MPVYGGGGIGGPRRRRHHSRRRPSRGGHPSRGGTTVGGGTGGNPIRRYHTPPAPRPAPSRGGHPSRGGTTVRGGTRRHPQLTAFVPTYFGHREVSSQRQYRRILHRQERKIQSALEDVRIEQAHRQAIAETRRSFAKDRKPGWLESSFDKTLENSLGAGAGAFASLGAKVGLHTGVNLATSGDVRRATLRGLRDIPAGMLQGAAMALSDPKGAVKGMAAQYEHTYGPALKGNWGEFKRRQEEEGGGGAIQVLADGTIIVGGVGAGLGKLARAGALGRDARAIMSEPRPMLRYSGGREGGVREQEISPSYFGARRQRRRDARRQKVYERRVAAMGNEDFGPTLRVQQRPRRRNGVLTGGEVVPRGGFEVGVGARRAFVPAPRRLRTAERLQRKQAAREKGQRRIVMLEEQHALQRLYANTAGRKVGKRIGALTAPEQKAFRYVYGGLMAAHDAPTALRHLRERRMQILDHRQALSASGKRRSLPGPRRRFNEELRVINDLVDRLEKGDPVLSDTLRGSAERMRRAEVAIARGRADLEDVPLPGRVSQTQLRRYMPQAEFLARMDQRARGAARAAGGRPPEGLLPPIRTGEKMGSYIERVGLRKVVERAQSEGMLRPGYFPSERRFTTRFSDSAIGGGRGLVDDRNYTGELFRRGEEDTRPEVLLAGLMRGVKRRHNMNLLAEQVEKHMVDLGPTERELKAVGRRRAKSELKRRRAADEAAARELGVSLKDLEAIGKSIARNHRRTQKHAQEVYAPNLYAFEQRLDGLRARIGRVNEEFTNPEEHAYRDELVSARDRLSDRVEKAKMSGDLETWRQLREDRDHVQGELSEWVDRQTRMFAHSNRLHRELEEVQDELAAIRRGDRVTGAPEHDAKDVAWYHGTHRDFGAELPKVPEPNGTGRFANDLGVYLTSDPRYADQYGGLDPAQSGYAGKEARGRRYETYVQPRKTLETRFGRVQPQDMVDVLDRLLERAQRASEVVIDTWRDPLREYDRLSTEYAEALTRARLSRKSRGESVDAAALREDPEVAAAAARWDAIREHIPLIVRNYSRKIEKGDPVALFERGEQLAAARARLANPDDPFTMAASGRGPREYELTHDAGAGRAGDADPLVTVYDGLSEWQVLDESVMRSAPSDLADLEAMAFGGADTANYTQLPTRETLLDLGFDSVRKVDRRADSLVVLDEKILRRAPATGRMDELMAAEADLRTAHDGLRKVRESGADDLLEDAIKVRDDAEARFAAAREGARAEVDERAGQLAVQAAHERLARDSTPGPGRTIKELVDDLERAQIDPAEVTFFNPGRVYSDYGRSAVPDERFGVESIEQGDRGLLEALNGNVLRGEEVARLVKTRPEEFEQIAGWIAVPKAVGDEVLSAAQPEHISARLWDIGKGKFSRILLGLGNVSWLAFQVGSNAFLSGLFGHVGPLDMFRAQKWWNALSDDERASFRPILGQSAHHMDFDRRYLGSTAANSTIVNAKRAMEKTAWWQAARKGNPIDLMFKLDAHQNLFFRRALLYSQAKRRMFQRMGETTHDIVNVQDRIMGTLTKRADRQLMDYLDDKHALELHGRKVDELLGDYLTYTHNERRFLQRFVMFYGFVRHSTRLALWTLPTQHPITVAILAKLALLGQDEASELLGGDQLPWGIGKWYFRGSDPVARAFDAIPGVDVPDTDQVMEIDLARMSPATNAFLDIRSANQIARVFPPFLSMLVSQIAEEDLNTGKDWQVRGMTRETLKRFSPFGSPYSFMDHVKVLAGDLSRTVPPVRYAERVVFVGPQGDDASLLFGQSPTKYRRQEIVDSVAEQRRRTLSRPAGQRLLDTVLPFLPKPSEDPRIVKDRAKRQAEADKARRKYMEGEGTPIERFRRSIKRSPDADRERLRRFRESLRGSG